MTGDPEAEAIAILVAALAKIDPAAQGRVIQWAAERYLMAAPQAVKAGRSVANRGVLMLPRTAVEIDDGSW